MLDENPGLLQLRILQQVGESPGSTLVYGAPDRAIVPRPAGAQRARGTRPGSEDAPG
jgi:hypothetical protein